MVPAPGWSYSMTSNRWRRPGSWGAHMAAVVPNELLSTSAGFSPGKEHGLLVALQVDVELQTVAFAEGNQRGPAGRVLDGGQHRVGGVGVGFVGKVDPGHQPVQEAAGEHRH